MKNLTSISGRILLMAFACVTMLRTTAHSSSLDEHFKTTINTAMQNVQETPNAVDKRKMLGTFLMQMDRGLETAKSSVSEKDGQALIVLQLKMRTDLAELNANGIAKVPDAQLNHFANYVQQDVEQADQVVYISAGGLIIILLILLLILR